MSDLIDRYAATQTALKFIVEYLGGAFDEDLQKKLMERMNDIPSALQQYDEEFRKKHYEISYNQGYVDGYKMCEARMKRGDPHE